MNVAIYARVSTEEQKTENQVEVLREWAKQRGLTLVKVYEETASAWKNGHQKRLAELMEDARKGKFQVVMVWALDRLTREGAVKQVMIWQKLQGYGVKLLSRQQDFTELPDEFVPVIMSIFGYIGSQESRLRSERTKAAMALLKEKGVKLGRPRKNNKG